MGTSLSRLIYTPNVSEKIHSLAELDVRSAGQYIALYLAHFICIIVDSYMSQPDYDGITWMDFNFDLDRMYGPASIAYYNNNTIVERWYCHGVTHNTIGPAIITYRNGKISSKEWYQNEQLYNDSGPAVIKYHENNNIKEKEWYKHGLIRHGDAPGTIKYDKHGNKIKEQWYRDGVVYKTVTYQSTGNVIISYYEKHSRHRNYGPAVITYFSNMVIKKQQWYTKGKLHRSTGPAIIDYDSSGEVIRERWFNDGNLFTPNLDCYHDMAEDETIDHLNPKGIYYDKKDMFSHFVDEVMDVSLMRNEDTDDELEP